MADALWTSVSDYLDRLFVPPDQALDEALRAAAAAGLPPIQVTPTHGKLLHLLAKVRGAERILEIGTLGGYSTIWLARALPPGGRMITLEINPKHAALAADNLARAGLADVVEVRLGPALETLPRLADEGAGPFDLIFIDADKPSNPEYLAWALRLARRGTVIVVDNVVRSGGVVDPASEDPAIAGTRRVLDLLAAEPGVTATVIQTVSDKGYDGLALAVVTGDV